MSLTAFDVNTRHPLSKEVLPGRDPSSIELPNENKVNLMVEYAYNCNVIRKRINAFLKSGEMNVTQFQRKLGINNTSYSRFMKLRGPSSGFTNQTFEAAYFFFKKRDLCGVKDRKPKKMSSNEVKKVTDVSSVTLPREDSQKVPVYDTCDDLRRKITKHLQDTGMSNAAFCRTINEFARAPVTSRNFSTFINKHGPAAGAKSPVFYASYVYFEKLRVKKNAPKTKKRQEMENVHGADGMSDHDANDWVWQAPDDCPHFDKYGKFHIN
ncbi:MAG: hypothetical protein Q9227_004765 [Pyrenula ochraceoflavens]